MLIRVSGRATDILDIIRTRVFAIVIVGNINKRFRAEVTNDMRRLKTLTQHTSERE